MTQRNLIILVVLVVLLVGAIFWWRMSPESLPITLPGNSTTTTGEIGWVSTTTASGISFQYPENLGTRYISKVDWPPMAQLSSDPFTCTEAGSETERSGETKRETISGREYCVTRVTGAAAGSVYTQYAYATERNNQVLILTFSLRAPQCANYDEQERVDCEAERQAFDVGSLVDRIVATLK